MLKIAAVSYVSLSEIQTVAPWVTDEFVEENPDVIKKMLFDLGMDVYNYPHEVQEVTHRNRFNNIITCKRFVGNERIDKEWIDSGHCSVEARDKSLDNKILTDLYRSKGLVESV
jgi:hypothetical protein